MPFRKIDERRVETRVNDPGLNLGIDCIEFQSILQVIHMDEAYEDLKEFDHDSVL